MGFRALLVVCTHMLACAVAAGQQVPASDDTQPPADVGRATEPPGASSRNVEPEPVARPGEALGLPVGERRTAIVPVLGEGGVFELREVPVSDDASSAGVAQDPASVVQNSIEAPSSYSDPVSAAQPDATLSDQTGVVLSDGSGAALSAQSDAASSDGSAAAPPGITNDDVQQMVNAGFSEATIVAAILANPSGFDVTPKALLSLNAAGVPEKVIEVMLATESAKRQAAAQSAGGAEPPATAQLPVPATTEHSGVPASDGAPDVEPTSAAPDVAAQAPTQMSPEALAVLTQVMEQLAAQGAASAESASGGSGPDVGRDDSARGAGPHAWIVDGKSKVALPSTIAQVAFTDAKGAGNATFKTLQGLAGKALAFANPALGLASGLGGLFRSGDPTTTAVWALLGAASLRELESGTVLEVEYGNIPGVNPDDYRPAIVQLVPTDDNYRLVGAARTKASETGGIPSGPIIEEPVAVHSARLGRGSYRVTLGPGTLPTGEYALVLRPIEKKERRRNSDDGSLGALMGGGTSEILYITWDFSIRS